MTSTSPRRYLSWLTALTALLIVLVLLTHFHRKSSPLDGRWFKTDGSPDMPDEITVRVTRTHFITRYWKDGGVERVTLLLDGQEHLFSSTLGGTKANYTATRDGDTVIVSKRFNSPFSSGPNTERWSLSDNGHKLVVLAQEKETVFRRASFLDSLFRSSP